MADKLKFDAINALQHPLIAHRCGGDRWPILDIDVETGLMRIDVVGRSQPIHFSELLQIEDGNGDMHDPDVFYHEDEGGAEDMHTATDSHIESLIARRAQLEADYAGAGGDMGLKAKSASMIHEINLKIMDLQCKKADDPATSITEKTVWTTRDGRTHDTLEAAIAHQRQGQILDAIYNGHSAGGSDAVCGAANVIAANAAEIFALLEPFFRNAKGD